MIKSAKTALTTSLGSDCEDGRPSSFVVPSRETARRGQRSSRRRRNWDRARRARNSDAFCGRSATRPDLTLQPAMRRVLLLRGRRLQAGDGTGRIGALEEFFAGQARRGVTFASLEGAEPALEQDRLEIANRHSPRGAIFTNGTIRIRSSINYPIVISIWGDPETTASVSRRRRVLEGAQDHQW